MGVQKLYVSTVTCAHNIIYTQLVENKNKGRMQCEKLAIQRLASRVRYIQVQNNTRRHIHSKEYLSQFSIDYVGQLIASLNTEESSVIVKDPT